MCGTPQKNSSRPTGGCMTELHKLPGETEEKFIWRLGMAKEAGDIQMNWEEIAKIINKEFREDESEYYNESAYRKPYQQAKRFYEAGVFKDLTDEKYVELGNISTIKGYGIHCMSLYDLIQLENITNYSINNG